MFAIGSMVDTAMQAREILLEKGIHVSVCNARFAKPLDEEYLKEAAKKYRIIFTLEENVLSGGFGEHVLAKLNELGYDGRVEMAGILDEFIQHGAVEVLKEKLKIDVAGIVKRVENL